MQLNRIECSPVPEWNQMANQLNSDKQIHIDGKRGLEVCSASLLQEETSTRKGDDVVGHKNTEIRNTREHGRRTITQGRDVRESNWNLQCTGRRTR